MLLRVHLYPCWGAAALILTRGRAPLYQPGSGHFSSPAARMRHHGEAFES